MKFKGIYTPVVTPYDEDFVCNEEALAETIEFLIKSGVNGLVIAGSTGEYYAQTMKERIKLMEICKNLIKSRLPMIVGTGAIRTEDSIEYARQAKRIGADALLVTTPPYAYPTGREIALHALAIDRAADLPIMLYNYPGRMSVNMDRDTLDRVGRSKNFCGIKESSGDINRLHMLAREYPHISLSCGMDDQALEFFAWGAESWVLEKNFQKGRLIMTAMLPLMTVLEQGGKFVQSIKHGLTLRGIDAGPPRKPLQPLNKEDKRELREVITTMNKTISSITGEPI